MSALLEVSSRSVSLLVDRGRCPVTGLAESLGAESGSVAEIRRSRWLTDNLPAIHVPRVAWAGYLHGRSLFR
jgi:hypothetical protein